MTWIRHGECNGCGFCCEKVAREVIVRTPVQVSRDRAFYLARGFQKVEVDGEQKYVLWAWLDARCPKLDVSDGAYRCTIYAERPRTCQTFPRIPQDIVGTPCSYWFSNGANTVGGSGSPHPSTEADLVQLELAQE